MCRDSQQHSVAISGHSEDTHLNKSAVAYKRVSAFRRTPTSPAILSIIPALILLAGVFAAPANLRADVLDRLRHEYPSASEQLEARYSQVKIKTSEQLTDEHGELLFTQRCEYVRDGNLVRKYRTVLKSQRSDTPVGYVAISGGSSEKYFIVSKRPGDEQFTVADYGSKNETDFAEHAQMSCSPLFASRFADVTNIREYLALPFVQLVSGHEVLLDGQRVLDVLVKETSENAPHADVHLYFLLDSWAFAGWTRPVLWANQKMSDPHDVIHLRVTYSNNDPLKLSSVKRWISSTTAPGAKKDEEYITVESIEFGSTRTHEFTLAALGVDEPGTVRAESNWLLVAVNVLIFTALGIWFALLAYRHKRRTVA